MSSVILQYSFIICVELVVKKIVAAAKEKEALQSERLSFLVQSASGTVHGVCSVGIVAPPQKCIALECTDG